MFRKNTAAFVHVLPSGISNVDGDSTYVRVQVLTNAVGSIAPNSLADVAESDIRNCSDAWRTPLGSPAMAVS